MFVALHKTKPGTENTGVSNLVVVKLTTILAIKLPS